MKNDNVKSCPVLETKVGPNETTYEQLAKKVGKWREIKSRIEKSGKCPSGSKCNRPIYNVRTEITHVENTNKAYVYIQLESPTVQNVFDSYAYDFQSLIGEVGGTLGLFLGLSTYSLVEFFTYFLERLFCQHK